MSRVGVRARKARKQKVIAAGLLFFTVAVFATILIERQRRPAPPDALLCPASGATGHVVLLIDRTDPLGFTQRKALEDLLASFANGKRIREGELLSVYALGEDFKANAEPVFMRCHPGDGSGKSEMTDNLRLWKERYEKEFAHPIRELPDSVVATVPANGSPIIEMIQLVGLAYERHDVRANRRFYIVSDMLQNTGEHSHFRETPNFEQFAKQPSFAKKRSKLSEVDVHLLMLMHRPELQRGALVQFWEQYFKDAGATMKHVDPLPG